MGFNSGFKGLKGNYCSWLPLLPFTETVMDILDPG